MTDSAVNYKTCDTLGVVEQNKISLSGQSDEKPKNFIQEQNKIKRNKHSQSVNLTELNDQKQIIQTEEVKNDKPSHKRKTSDAVKSHNQQQQDNNTINSTDKDDQKESQEQQDQTMSTVKNLKEKDINDNINQEILKKTNTENTQISNKNQQIKDINKREIVEDENNNRVIVKPHLTPRTDIDDIEKYKYSQLVTHTANSEDIEIEHSRTKPSKLEISNSMTIVNDTDKNDNNKNSNHNKNYSSINKNDNKMQNDEIFINSIYQHNQDIMKKFSKDKQPGLILPFNQEVKEFKINNNYNTPKNKGKKKEVYNNFAEEDNISSFTDSLPPSDVGDVVVNISAIEIDKNELSIYNSPKKEDENEATAKNHENEQNRDLLNDYANSRCQYIKNIMILVILVAIFTSIIIYFLKGL